MRNKPDHGEETYKGLGRLSGKAALITGGDSGIGRAVAIAYAREGADVAISRLPQEEADARETVRWVKDAGRKCLDLPGDIRDESFCRELVARAACGLRWGWRRSDPRRRVEGFSTGQPPRCRSALANTARKVSSDWQRRPWTSRFAPRHKAAVAMYRRDCFLKARKRCRYRQRASRAPRVWHSLFYPYNRSSGKRVGFYLWIRSGLRSRGVVPLEYSWRPLFLG